MRNVRCMLTFSIHLSSGTLLSDSQMPGYVKDKLTSFIVSGKCRHSGSANGKGVAVDVPAYTQKTLTATSW